MATIWNWLVEHRWFLAIFLAFSVYSYFSRAKQKEARRSFAADHNFKFLGKHLPDDLSLNDTPFSRFRFSVSNAMIGNLRGNHLAVFDVSDRGGEIPIEQTVLAFRRGGDLRCDVAPADRVGSFRFAISGEWLLGYIESRLVANDELEDWCNELYDLALRLIREMNTEPKSRDRSLEGLFREF
jgi:hypothetical protein